MLICTSFVIKIAYSSQLVSIIPAFNSTKSSATLGMTFYYLTYAASQIVISGWMKKINMKLFIVVTTVVSAISFVLMMFVREMWQMWAIMGINGILQSGIYGGCMSYMGRFLPDSWSATLSKLLSFNSVASSILAYAISAFFMAVLDWRYTFLFCSVVLLISVMFFYVVVITVRKKVPPANKIAQSEGIQDADDALINKMSRAKVYGIFSFTLVAALIINCGYYGINTWIPNLLKEKHGVDESIALLITLVMPIGIYFGSVAAIGICKKKTNYFLVGSLFLAMGAVCSFGLIFTYDINMVAALLLSFLYLFFVRGVHIVFTAYIPMKMKHVVDVGKTSMISNAAVSFGAAAMPFVSGLVMDMLGWQKYYVVILGVSGVAALMLLAAALIQGKKKLF